MKNCKSVGLICLLLALPGCGAGMLAKAGANRVLGNDKPPAERIAAAQEKAISSVHGGTPGIPIAWSDDKAGIQGALTFDAGAPDADGCRTYQQTVILSAETLQGYATACPQKDGSWKLSDRARQPHR